MYQALWIEGENALKDFCQKHFGERPHFVETIGHCGSAIIWKMYKQSPDGYCDFYLIFIPYHKGDWTYGQLQDKRMETYEQITAYRTTVRKR